MRKLSILILALPLLVGPVQSAAAKEAQPPVKVQLGAVPKNLKPGQPWRVTATYTSGGRAIAIRNLIPGLELRNDATGKQILAYMSPTKRPGVYAATVKLPSAGTWVAAVHDNGQSYTFKPLKIGAPSGGGFSFRWPAIGAGFVLAFAALLVVLLRARRTKAVAIPREA